MKIKKLGLTVILLSSFLGACKADTSVKYTLTFYQRTKNWSDDFEVTVGKTTLDEIKTYANGLRNCTPTGYDRTWDWDNFDFEHQKEDWTIVSIPVLHNYKISFTLDGVEKGSTTYTCQDTDYTVPEIAHPTHGYKYVEKEHLNIVGQYKDLVSEIKTVGIEYKVRFHVSDDDPNPTTLTYCVESPNVTSPTGPEGYDCVWKTKDGIVSFNGSEKKDMSVVLKGAENFADLDLYLNKTAKKYTVTLDVNGGSMTEGTEVQATFDQPISLPTPTFKENAKFLGWVDSENGMLLNNGDKYNIAKNATLYACYGIDFENANNLKLIIKANEGITRDTIDKIESDTTTYTNGTTSAKLTSKASATFSCSFDKDFVTSAFKNPAVKAINFDLKTSVPCTKLSYANNVETSYEFDYNKGGEPHAGYGAQTIWKTFSFTREMYTKANTLGNANVGYIVTVGGQLPTGSNVWIDNVRPVTKNLNVLDFDNSYMVDYVDPKGGDPEWYSSVLSFRNMNNKETFIFAPTVLADSKFAFSYDIKNGGLRSVKAHRYTGSNVNVSVGEFKNVESITFDVYSTRELTTSEILTGTQAKFLTENLPANKWMTYTISKENIKVDEKIVRSYFLWLTGAASEYDIYFDNVKVVTSEE